MVWQLLERSAVGSSADPATSVLIVTGAHPAAEVFDRPIAYRLREQVLGRLGSDSPRTEVPPQRVVVCSDLWYLNSEELRELPTISVGGPTVNALTAYLGDKLPSAYAVDGLLLVQAAWTDQTPLACCWGIHAQATATAVETFTQRYLDGFLDAVGAA
jgi:hypothetical protein